MFHNQLSVTLTICYHQAGDADAAELRVHVVPHPDAAPPDPLTHRQLQEEQGDADEDEEDEVGHQVRAWERAAAEEEQSDRCETSDKAIDVQSISIATHLSSAFVSHTCLLFFL